MAKIKLLNGRQLLEIEAADGKKFFVSTTNNAPFSRVFNKNDEFICRGRECYQVLDNGMYFLGEKPEYVWYENEQTYCPGIALSENNIFIRDDERIFRKVLQTGGVLLPGTGLFFLQHNGRLFQTEYDANRKLHLDVQAFIGRSVTFLGAEFVLGFDRFKLSKIPSADEMAFTAADQLQICWGGELLFVKKAGKLFAYQFIFGGFVLVGCYEPKIQGAELKGKRKNKIIYWSENGTQAGIAFGCYCHHRWQVVQDESSFASRY